MQRPKAAFCSNRRFLELARSRALVLSSCLSLSLSLYQSPEVNISRKDLSRDVSFFLSPAQFSLTGKPGQSFPRASRTASRASTSARSARGKSAIIKFDKKRNDGVPLASVSGRNIASHTTYYTTRAVHTRPGSRGKHIRALIVATLFAYKSCLHTRGSHTCEVFTNAESSHTRGPCKTRERRREEERETERERENLGDTYQVPAHARSFEIRVLLRTRNSYTCELPDDRPVRNATKLCTVQNDDDISSRRGDDDSRK